MLSRMGMAVGVLGVGALTLVGVGSYASFTSQGFVSDSITPGHFQLQLVPGLATVSGPLIGDANPTGKPVMAESVTSEPSLPNGNTLSYTLGNAAPGDTYSYRFTVYDVGTLQGQLNTITYTPGTNGTNALEHQMTVSIHEVTGPGATTITSPIHTTAEESTCTGCGSAGIPVSAAAGNTFKLDYSWGPAFLQPHILPTGKTYNGDENSATFQVTFNFQTASNNNAVETVAAHPTMTVNGVNTP